MPLVMSKETAAPGRAEPEAGRIHVSWASAAEAARQERTATNRLVILMFAFLPYS